MLTEKTRIGPGLFFMALYVSMFGYSVSQAPRVAAEHMGHNGYWGFVLAFMLSIPVMAGIAWLGKRFPNRSVIEYLPQLFGTFFGKVLGFLFLTAILILLVWTSRMLIEEVHLYFLSRTPVWAPAALFLLVALFLAHQGIEGISRLASFVFPLTFGLSFLAIFFSLQNFELDNIRPVFFFESGPAVGGGTVHLFYPFLALLTALMLNPYLTEKKKSFQVMTGAAALVFFLILLAIVSGIGNYGAAGILRYSYPVLELTRKANLPFVLQTFGLFFGATWLSQALIAGGLFYFLLSEGAAQWLRVLNYKWFTLILFPLIFLFSILPSGVIEMRTIFPSLRVGGFLFTVGLVVLLIVVAVLRRGGDPENAS